MRCVVNAGDLLKAINTLQKGRAKSAAFTVKDGVLQITQNTVSGFVVANVNTKGDCESGSLVVHDPFMLKAVLTSVTDEDIVLSSWPSKDEPRRLQIQLDGQAAKYLIPVIDAGDSEDLQRWEDNALADAELFAELKSDATKAFSEVAKYTASKTFSVNDYVWLVPKTDGKGLLVSVWTGPAFYAVPVDAAVFADKILLLPPEFSRCSCSAILFKEEETDRDTVFLMHDCGYVGFSTIRLQKNEEERMKRLFNKLFNNDEATARIQQSVSYWSGMLKAVNALVGKKYKGGSYLVVFDLQTLRTTLVDRYDKEVLWNSGETLQLEGEVESIVNAYTRSLIAFDASLIATLLDFIKMPTSASFLLMNNLPALCLRFGDSRIAMLAPLVPEVIEM